MRALRWSKISLFIDGTIKRHCIAREPRRTRKQLKISRQHSLTVKDNRWDGTFDMENWALSMERKIKSENFFSSFITSTDRRRRRQRPISAGRMLDEVSFTKTVFSFLFAFHLLATSSSTEASRQHQQLTVYFHSLNNLLSSTTKKKSLKEEKYFRQKYLGYSISEACVDKTCWCGWRFFWHIFGGRFGRWLSELFGGAATTCAPFSLRSNVI